MRASGETQGWHHVFWATHECTPAITRALDEMGRMPGVGVAPLGVHIPVNAVHTEPVQAFVREACVQLEDPAVDVEAALRLVHTRGLYPHQLSGVRFLAAHGGGLLADGLGVGKTAVAATTAAMLLQQYARPVLIVAPKFTRGTWQRELQRLGFLRSPEDWCALESRDFHHASFQPNAWWYFLHYEIAEAWWSKLTATSRRPIVGILDEAHWATNGRTGRGKGAAMTVGCCPHRILLTGTPIVNVRADLWHLLTLTTGAGSWGSRNAFRIRYCGARRNDWGWEDGEPTNDAELQTRLAGCYLRRTLEDTGITLPAFRRVAVEADLDALQPQHDAALGRRDPAALVHALISGQMRDGIFELLAALRRITSRAKLSTTAELVSNVLHDGGSCVVFCWQPETAKALRHKVASSLPSYVVSGEDDEGVRDALVQRFQQAGGALFATYGVLREGVTLHRANHVVLHDLAWTMKDVLQAEKRIHRIGQTRPCLAHWVICRDSIDEIFARVLYAKSETIDHSLGDHAALDAAHDVGLPQFAQRRTAEVEMRDALTRWTERTY